MPDPVHVTVSGASGNVGYALLSRIASGQVLGPDQPVVLRLLDIEPAMGALEGVVMELDDSAHRCSSASRPRPTRSVAFDGASWVLLVGSMPRKEGMERGDLLKINGGIFGPYGAAINEHAASDVRVLVVGNPCNTNCLIAQSHAPDVPADRWYAMTRLDENRARTQLAKKAGVHHAEVTNVAIWGNHSATQYPDFANARIGGRPVPDVITDRAWLEGEFIETIQKRGAAVIAKRGQSSATSAAHAIVDSVNSIHTPTPGDDWHSLAVVSTGEYGVPEGLVFGYPVRSDGRVDVGRRRHRARRLRPGEDRRHHRGARRRTRRGPRAARELMPAAVRARVRAARRCQRCGAARRVRRSRVRTGWRSTSAKRDSSPSATTTCRVRARRAARGTRRRSLGRARVRGARRALDLRARSVRPAARRPRRGAHRGRRRACAGGLRPRMGRRPRGRRAPDRAEPDPVRREWHVRARRRRRAALSRLGGLARGLPG